ncbi:MAG: hypothetical protein KDC98_10745 [Planctomycetes bacterium]|nr:hypothetical protein [Planctomycetota bacterium]MCA9822467.1 hypothetical protein [Dehalococcoidia bacterium]
MNDIAAAAMASFVTRVVISVLPVCLAIAVSSCDRHAPGNYASPAAEPTLTAPVPGRPTEEARTAATRESSLSATRSPDEVEHAPGPFVPFANEVEATPLVTAVAPGSTSAEDANEPDRHVSSIAFVPGSLDLAFTVNKGYAGGPPALFVQRSGSSGEPEILALLPEAAIDYRAVVASEAAGLLAALTQDDSDGGRYRVHVMTPDGADDRDLTRGEINPLQVGWLPDGSAMEVLTESAELMTIDPANGERRVIAAGLYGESGGPAAETAWSPDARRVVITGIDASFRPRLELIDLETGTREPIAIIEGAWRVKPFFSADGEELFVLVERRSAGPSSSHGPTELWTMVPRPSSDPRRLTTLPIPSGLEPEVVVHPDGTHLYLLLDDRVWRVGTDGAGLALVAGDGDARSHGPLIFTRTAAGEEQLAWISVVYHGPAPAGVEPRLWASTTSHVQSVDPRGLPGAY